MNEAGHPHPLVDHGREPRRGRGGAGRRRRITLPAIIRPAFTMGGQGGGIADTETELRQVVSEGLAASPINQVLVEESVIGWGEFELEVMRDRNDNVVIICSIENVDPMGVHTGDSVTVAPAQSLTDPLYQDAARHRDQGDPRDRGRDRRLQRPVRGQPRGRRDRRDRDEPAGLALLGAGLEGDRLPDREDGGQAGGRLRAGGDPERHHPGHARLLRADDRLRRHQDPALRLREVPRRRRPPLDLHAERRRGRCRSAAPSASPSPRRCARASSTRRRSSPSPTRSCWSAIEMPCAERFDLVLAAFRRGLAVEAVHEQLPGRPLVPARAASAGAATATAPRASSAPTRRSTPAPPSSRRRRPTTTRPTSARSRRLPPLARSAAATSRLGRDPRRRPEPDRPGDRVRLLLRPRRDDRPRAAAATR